MGARLIVAPTAASGASSPAVSGHARGRTGIVLQGVLVEKGGSSTTD
jgi:hypothetical protein